MRRLCDHDPSSPVSSTENFQNGGRPIGATCVHKYALGGALKKFLNIGQKSGQGLFFV
jgi:hypothetical protein